MKARHKRAKRQARRARRRVLEKAKAFWGWFGNDPCPNNGMLAGVTLLHRRARGNNMSKTKKRYNRQHPPPNANVTVRPLLDEEVLHVQSSPGLWVSDWPSQNFFAMKMPLASAQQLIEKLQAGIMEYERLEKIRQESLALLSDDQKKALGIT